QDIDLQALEGLRRVNEPLHLLELLLLRERGGLELLLDPLLRLVHARAGGNEEHRDCKGEDDGERRPRRSGLCHVRSSSLGNGGTAAERQRHPMSEKKRM